MKINAALVSTLIDFAASRGMNATLLQAMVKDKNIDYCALEAKIDLEDYLAILTKISTTLADARLGISFGLYLNLSALGLVHTISLQSSSIEQALLILESYLQNNFPLLTIKKNILGSQIQLQLDTKIKTPVLRKNILDTSFCLIFRELKLMMGATPLGLALPYADLLSYELHLGHPIQSSHSHCFSLPQNSINQPINARNLQQIECLLPKYLQMIQTPDHAQSFAANTRRMILHLCAPELPSLKMVCRQFSMSSRTFQRKLNQEGSSFREISLEIKKELSNFLQAGNKMKTKDIAYILGYSESSAYLNAKKNW
ncbi:helix-turn-helix domain-containing protein [Aureispira anguillae]|uniref:AraC family transcriptional regulator n=1 Tax=Aureispira anguillae TaxID=2864201 RepID=A0A915VK84_9BACT|nr:AraC family transcriptional regulator [Aureispira anguillae]BDS09455.1 AraC family transcriptional regulator [Aureispira anguillae]